MNKMKHVCRFSLSVMLLSPAALTLVVWLSARYSDLLNGPEIYYFGELSALVALSYMTLSIALSTRARLFDRMLCGIDKAYRIHAISGIMATAAAVIHPVLVASRYASSLSEYPAFLFFSGWLGKDIGVASLYLLVAGIVATFLPRLPYEKWKLLHKLMLPVFILTAVHALSVSTLPQHVKWYIAMLAALGIPCGTYSIVREYIAGKKFRVKSVRSMGSVTEIVFDGKISFIPGQFVFVKFLRDGMNEFHPFSIVSSPGENLKIAAKALGDFTSRLPSVRKGDIAVVDGPYGGFTIDRGGKKQLWIAGGIGVTPFVSLSSVAGERDIVMIYTAKTSREFVYADILGKRVMLFMIESLREGRITAEKVVESVPDVAERDVFICGPEGMKRQLIDGLSKIGVENFVYEEFRLR